MKNKDLPKYLLSGAAIGVGAAIPGVSGGTIAVMFKVFEKIIWAASNLFKHFKDAAKILLPIVIGAICAGIPCLILFKFALEGFVFGIVSLFAGFIIGSFPSIKGEVKDVPIKVKHIIQLIIGLLFALGIGVCAVFFGDKIDLNGHFQNPEWWFFLVLIPVGMICSVAFIVPGISGSMILLILGFYKPVLKYCIEYIKDPSKIGLALGYIGCLALGAIIGVLAISKFLNYLLKEHHASTFFVIIGFIIGSTIALYINNDIWSYYMNWAGTIDEPFKTWMPIYIEIPVGILLMVAGAFGSYKLAKYSEKIKEVPEEATINE